MKEKTLMRISLIGSIVSLIALYILSLQIHYTAHAISDINEGMLGRTVNVSGTITDIRAHKNGHLFLTIRDDTGTIKVVLWETLVDSLKYSGMNISEISRGRRIRIIGDVDIYKGQLEIIPKAPRDVKLLP